MRFNQTDYAQFYHRQMIDGGYPGKLLPFVIKELQDSLTVLDIGSGTGFFTIPLAEAGHRVTAVEPSDVMIDVMMKNFSSVTLSTVEINRTLWENWSGEMHDAAISVHSLYPMPDVKKAVIHINNSAAKKIIIIRDSLNMVTLTGVVREKLGITSNRDLNDEINIILNEIEADWKVVNIYEERKHFIGDIQQEADSILYQLKLDQRFKNDICDVIKKEINTLSDRIFFNTIYSDNAYIF